MPEEPTPLPVLSYIAGNLTGEERRQLEERALHDQAVFDELLDAEEDRELLEDSAVRARLVRRLEESAKPALLERLRRWLLPPSTRYLLAGAAAALAVAVFVGLRAGGGGGGTFEPLGIITGPATGLSEFFRLPLHDARQIALDLGRAPAVFHPGEVVRATVRLRRGGAVFVMRSGPGGTSKIVYPPDVQMPAGAAAGTLLVPFDPAPPTMEIPAAQTVRLRVLVLPAGSDLRTQAIDWKKLGGNYAAMETSYTVAP